MKYRDLSVGDFFILKAEAEQGTAFLIKKTRIGSLILIEQLDSNGGGMSTNVEENTEVVKIKKINK
jgi:hypothetical protein